MNQTYKLGLNGTDNEIMEAWEPTGLLDCINGDNKLRIAKVLDRTANILKNSNKYSGRIETIIFPVIRRLSNKLVSPKDPEFDQLEWAKENKSRGEMLIELLDANSILDRVDKVLVDFISVVETLYDYDESKHIDIEAETCALISDILFSGHMGYYRSKNLSRNSNGTILVEDK